ncbi:MAG: polysaccharide deacetylase [Rhodospirillaceae bacterium]|nr:polysaccharide deacetylase [Magnetovibrio sp.]MAY66862.1 polysaccharide deacetylase [Rhodospirillaceae bacterium]
MRDVTLTFDNGPEPDVTPGVLDVLARAGVPASFFVLGHKIADPARRKLAERAAAEGHWIANHTYSHDTPLGNLPGADVPETEIGRTQALIGDLAHPDRFFRPFGGGGALGPHLLSRPVADYLIAGRYTCVLWNAIPRDWADPEGWVETAVAQISPLDHALIVVHDLPTGAMVHLERFIETIRDAGGTFRQDFPEACVPLRRGLVVGDLAACVTEPAGTA